MPAISGVLDPITIKINQIPDASRFPVPKAARSRMAGGASRLMSVLRCLWLTRSVSVTIEVRPRIWKQLIEGSKQFHAWTAVITGRMGELTDVGFVLEHPGIQVFDAATVPFGVNHQEG